MRVSIHKKYTFVVSIALLVTVLVILLGYPFGYFMAKLPPRRRAELPDAFSDAGMTRTVFFFCSVCAISASLYFMQQSPLISSYLQSAQKVPGLPGLVDGCVVDQLFEQGV